MQFSDLSRRHIKPMCETSAVSRVPHRLTCLWTQTVSTAMPSRHTFLIIRPQLRGVQWCDVSSEEGTLNRTWAHRKLPEQHFGLSIYFTALSIYIFVADSSCRPSEQPVFGFLFFFSQVIYISASGTITLQVIGDRCSGFMVPGPYTDVSASIIHHQTGCSLKGTLCTFFTELVVKCYIAFKQRLLSSASRFETTAGGICQDSRSYDNNMSHMPRHAFCPSWQSIDWKNMAASVELTRPM